MIRRKWGLIIAGLVSSLLVAGTWVKKGYQAGPVEVHEPTNPVEFTLKDWKRALAALKDAFGNKNLSILAAGVAYYSTLAFFPLLAAAVAIAALTIEPERLQTVVAAVDQYMPEDVASLVSTQLETLVGRQSDNILAVVIAIVVSLYGASGASKNLVTASNVAYDVAESRSWLMQQLRGLGWIFGGLFFGFIVALILVVNVPILNGIGVFSPLADIVLYGRWILIVLLMILGLAVFYRYGPNRRNPKWQWISWGAVTATLLWLVATSLFFLYVQSFGNYAESYSLFAGIIILMVWLNFTALIVLLGAAVNHSLEKAAHESRLDFPAE